MKKVLSIAGSDCSGGAGIQADIKTMLANGVYAMSVITALTAQNTLGVSAVLDVDSLFLEQQMDSIFNDIYPDAIKIGMVSKGELIRAIAKKLREYKAENIVLDPVMLATSGARLISEEAIEVLQKELFPLAKVLTPNIPEAEVLSGIEIKTKEDMKSAAKLIGDRFDCAILCKGGHSISDASDVLYEKGEFTWFDGKRIDNKNTHGTGCTLSSAIASNFAKGMNMKEAIKVAKDYISGALADGMDIGKGSGPLNHAFDIKTRFK